MNTRPQRPAAAPPGETLIECLVYIAVFAIVIGCASKACFAFWDRTKALGRNADDIARALDVGERWRADVRGATGPVQLTAADGTEQCRIPAAAGEVIYTFANGQIRRQAGATTPDTLWLANVKSSHIQAETRGHAAAWRWELELKSTRKEAQIRPLFTFECAAGAATSP